jgi:pyruvate, orthophosphate dikinase
MSQGGPFLIGIAGATDELTLELAGAKASELWRMSRLGLPVPPAFVLPTTLCGPANRQDPATLASVECGLREGIERLEEATGRRLGDARMPLLVSVRSGAAHSMPGMMSTILDAGLNSRSVRGLIGMTGNPRLAWDSYRRFVQMYCEVVEGVPATAFEARLADLIRSEDVAGERDLDPVALEELVHEFHDIAARAVGHGIPAEPMEQLRAAALAVYRSWDSPRAVEYRRLNKLEGLAGTAVTVQAMVFGNAGGRSGAGVAFSRNPATGVKGLYVDFLFDAQGEDVVAGRRIPGDAAVLAARLPEVARQLADGASRLEREFRDVQDIEFTVEEGRLFFLQTRSAQRAPRAALRILVDLVHEGVLDADTALTRAKEIDLDHVGVARFVEKAPAVATATSASPGVATGRIAFDTARAKALAAGKEPVILLRHDISTEDIAGFAVATGILTATGGRTAHAAVVARQLGKVCLVGCRELAIRADGSGGQIGGRQIREGDWISLDGETGEVSLGRQDIIIEVPQAELAELEAWRHRSAATTKTCERATADG